MNKIDHVLSSGETIIWQGNPDKIVYLMPSILRLVVIVGVIIAGYVNAFGLQSVLYGGGILNIATVVILGWMFLGSLYTILAYRNMLYVFTDKRAILQRGLIGIDFDFVDYDKIESGTVEVSIWDKLLGRNTGTVQIYANRLVQVTDTFTDANGQTQTTRGTKNVPFSLYHVVDPYKVFNQLKSVSFDVKADIHYPNALRPQENTGYQTAYTPKQ